jgi:DNA-binding NarL/FixJ family response regulator
LRQAHEETVYHPFGFQEPPEDALRSAPLTTREITMLKALARGLSNKGISRELWRAEPTGAQGAVAFLGPGLRRGARDDSGG